MPKPGSNLWRESSKALRTGTLSVQYKATLPKGTGFQVGQDFNRAAEDVEVNVTGEMGSQAYFEAPERIVKYGRGYIGREGYAIASTGKSNLRKVIGDNG